MRVLVTGGAGFIASHLTDRLLAEGHDVTVIDDLSTGRIGNLDAAFGAGLDPRRFHRLDIADPAAGRVVVDTQPEVIMLIGAQMSVKVSMRDPLLDARSNILGLVNLMEAAVRAGTRKVVFASSGGTIFGRVPVDDGPIGERTPQHPTSFYGLTKMAGGEYLRLYQEHHGIEYAALALANVYGPRQDPGGEAGVIAIFCDRLLRGQRCVINGDGTATRNYVYVTDVVDAFVRAATRGGGLINISSGIETSVQEIFDELAGLIGVDAVPEYGPWLPGDVHRVRLDPTRAMSELGWRATVPLREGLAELVRLRSAAHAPAER